MVSLNQLTGDISYVRQSQPKPQRKKINQGITSTKSTKTSRTSTCVILNDRGIVDMDELAIAPDEDEYLLSENKPHIAGLGETFAEMVLYDNDPEGVVGLAHLYGKIGRQVVDAGGTSGALRSIFFVCWDPDELTGLIPKNTKTAGIQVKPQRDIYVKEKDGNDFLAHVTEYKWFVGLKLRNERYASRLCNIPADITNEVLFEKIIMAKNRIAKARRLKTVMYCSPDIYTRLETAALLMKNANITYKQDIENDTTIVSFGGVRIRENDCQERDEKKVA